MSYEKTSYSKLEFDICTLLQAHKLDNVVTIYSTQQHSNGSYKITMESICDKPCTLTVADRSRVIYDLCMGLKQLNDIGIIYAYIKLGNIGWSKDDNCWKLFDFDMAGLFQDNKFVLKPDLDGMGYPDDIHAILPAVMLGVVQPASAMAT